MKLNRPSVALEVFFTVIIGLFLWGSLRITDITKRIASQEFNPIPVMLTMFIVPILFGVLTGMPKLLDRWNSSKRFNWPRFIIQGIPALLLVAPYFLISDFLPVNLENLYWTSIQPYSHSGFIIYLAGMWFGRVLVDCIKGAPSEIEDASKAQICNSKEHP